jgi:hypothetical protein
MGTRAVTRVTDKQWVYTHWDGYVQGGLGEELYNAKSKAEVMWVLGGHAVEQKLKSDDRMNKETSWWFAPDIIYDARNVGAIKVAENFKTAKRNESVGDWFDRQKWDTISEDWFGGCRRRSAGVR